MTPPDFSGLRVLVVEDQMMVAIETQAMLEDLQCVVVGPVGTIGEAIRNARDERLDAAVLDVNLDGNDITPAIEELQARNIPFILATGYGSTTLPEHLRGHPLLEKPFRDGELSRLLADMCGR